MCDCYSQWKDELIVSQYLAMRKGDEKEAGQIRGKAVDFTQDTCRTKDAMCKIHKKV